MRPKLLCLTLAALLLAAPRAAAESSLAPLLPPPGAEEALPPPQDWSMPSEELPDEPNVVRIDDHAASNQPDHWFTRDAWDTGVELGLNGSSGTSESLSVRTGGYMKRESRFSKLDLKAAYNHTTESGNATQNNAQFDVRNDWLLDDRSPWTLYGTGEVFYDEFQAFDLQTSANTGIGYRFIYEPDLDLIGRFGAGASREFGGPDDRWVPESLLGFEYNQKLSPGQKFYAKLDYYPEWEQVGEFRLVADSGWQIQFAQPSNLSLKISASDRYDSTPHGADPHLVNYSVLLLLKL
jgi:putative salt-induced outer membrane protein YdiY